jgi:hypothetical protein
MVRIVVVPTWAKLMAAAVEDAKNFLDMERTGLVIVEEKTVLG